MIMKYDGILGGGNISETHARAVRETDGLEIAAFCGDNQEKVARLPQTHGGSAYTDLQKFLAHKPLDLVAIGSPSGLHAEQGIAVARRGLHVLVEKPIDVTVARADALIGACEKAKVKLGVFFQDRTAPDVQKLRELVRTGRLGKLILVSAHVKWYRPPEYYGNSKWRGKWALDGGGALMNQGIHTVDLLLWLVGDVVRVHAKAVTALHAIESEDTVAATLEFADGAIGTLEAATSAYPGFPRRLELTGSEGTIILEHDRIISADLHQPLEDWARTERPAADARATSPVISDVSGHQRILEDFLGAIETDSKPLCDGAEGRRSVALVQAIYESSRSGQSQRVN